MSTQNPLEVKPAEPIEPSIADMRSMLEGKSPEPVKVTPAAEPKPVVEPTATPKEEPKPVEPAAETPPAETPAGSEPDKPKETQEPTKEEKKGKFEPKEPEVPEGVQKRLNKMTWEKHEAERKAQQAAREADELRKKLAEKDQASGKPAEVKPAANFTEAEPVEPKEEAFDVYGDYLKAYTKYTDAHALWITRKDRFEYQAQEKAEQQRVQAEKTQREAAERQQAASKTWNERVVKLAEKEPDMHEAIDEVGQFLTKTGNAELIMESELGPEIVLYMYRHPDDTLKIAETGNAGQIARFIGRIEAQLTAASSTPAPKTEAPVKPLPEPIKPVGGGASPTKAVDLSDPKTSFDDFKKEAGRLIEAAQPRY